MPLLKTTKNNQSLSEVALIRLGIKPTPKKINIMAKILAEALVTGIEAKENILSSLF